MKNIFIVFMIALSIVACTPTTEPATLPPDTAVTSLPATDATPQAADTPIAPSFAPLPSDGNLQRGNVFISASELLIRESFPVQIALALSGETPTPCHLLRVVVNRPDPENKILVNAYTVSNPNVNCTQVVKPFQETVELGTFPTGRYTVWVNDTQVGEFDT